MTVPVFPTLQGLTYPVVRSPIWKTQVEESWSGESTAFQAWTYPRYRYTLQFSWLSSSGAIQDWQNLVGFYNSVGGGAGMFSFNDPQDNTVSNQQFGTGNGTTTQFQLVRTLGGFTEPVFSIFSITNISINGVTQLGGAYSYDNYGVLTFTSAPAAAATLTWSGQYYWYARFDKDTIDFNNFAYLFWELRKLELTTVKPKH